MESSADEATEEKRPEVTEVRVEGVWARTPGGPAQEWLRMLSGWAILVWVARGLSWLLGYRHDVKIELKQGSLRVARERSVLGKTITSSQESWTQKAVASVGKRESQASWPLYLGSLMFAVGVLLGGMYFVDGVRTGETYLLLAGAGLIAVGGGLDFGLHVLLPHLRGEVALDVRMLNRHRVSVRGLSDAEAGSFVGAVTASRG